MLDFSGSTVAITSAVLAAIPLFNLVDSFIGSDLGDTVDLALTGLDDFFGGAGDDDIIGTGSDNTLSGGAGDDDLSGGAGDDILIGGLGADALDGGAGSDTADYSGAASGVKVDIFGALAGLGEAAGDSFISIENIIGSAFQDQLYGTAGANVISAGAGNDFINGRGGADTIDGGAGVDRYYFSLAFGAATLDLSDQSNNAGQLSGASFTGVEQFFGSNAADSFTAGGEDAVFYGRGGDDVLIGGAGTDRLYGGNGDDIISGGDGVDYLYGGEGADAFDGGAGFDRVAYTDVNAGVVAYLDNPALNQGAAAGDTYVSIEALYGSNFTDTLVGSTGDDQLAGNNGHDVIFGGAGRDLIFGGNGNDRIIGNAGDDSLYGQAGNDTFVFNFSDGRDVIYDFTSGADEIEFNNGPASMADLTFTQVGSNLEIGSVNGTVVLFGLTQADISASDFAFNSPPAGSEQAILEAMELAVAPDEVFLYEAAFMPEAFMIDMVL